MVLMSGAFCFWVLFCVWAIQQYNGDSNKLIDLNDSAGVAAAATADSTPQVKITNELRYTTMGWQTPSHWMPKRSQGSQLSISGFPPVILGAGILLASLFAIVLFSPDREVERLIEAAKLKHEATAAYKLNFLRQLNKD